MKIVLSESLGYCLGVRRAMDLAFSALNRAEGEVYSSGPLIHNRPALDLLRDKGLLLWEEGNTPAKKGPGPATVIIRAHGLPPEEERKLLGAGLRVIDATCPRVAKVQRLVAREAGNGKTIIIWYISLIFLYFLY
jgi:4-hydroxy-3-methylbut-2-enyl diphosphate reductase